MSLSTAKLVSVIVCNYNYDRYLAEAIKSVLSQSYKDLQVVVVDDGSTDNSRQILESIEDSRLQAIYQNNSGQAAAFNSAYKECVGEYVAFLDSDDYWFERKLEFSIPAFEPGNVSLVQHNLEIVGPDSQPIGGIHPNIEAGRKSIRETYFKENHTGFFSATSGMICRKADLDEIFPIDEAWKICADVAFSRPLPIFGEVVTLEDILGAYRVHGDNQWMNTQEQKRWLENQRNYVNYTNEWLARYKFQDRIDFEKSDQYLQYRQLSGLPVPFFRKAGLWARKAKGRLMQLAKSAWPN